MYGNMYNSDHQHYGQPSNWWDDRKFTRKQEGGYNGPEECWVKCCFTGRASRSNNWSIISWQDVFMCLQTAFMTHTTFCSRCKYNSTKIILVLKIQHQPNQLTVCFSSNALVLTNIPALYEAQLVYGQVNHISTLLVTTVYTYLLIYISC